MIHVVTGHICSGKTTWVNERARAGDVVIDLDRIATALKVDGSDQHEHEDYIVEAAAAARWTAIDRIVRLHASGRFDVWIIHAYPGAKDVATYRRFGAAVMHLDVDHETLMDRARRTRGPKQLAHLAERLTQHPEGKSLHNEQKGL